MSQELENITAEQAFKSNANFEKYLELYPPEVMTSTLDEFKSIGADLHVIRYELTQKVESLSGALNQIAKKESATPSFIIWVFANEKEEVMELTRYIKQSESLGIFVFKASLNGDKMDVKCLLKPELKQKKKAVRNDNAPAKLLQKAYWDKYFEVCDELQSEMQVNPKNQHWQYIPIGKRGVCLMLTTSIQKQYVGVDLVINYDKQIFERLSEDKEKIENELGELEWVNIQDNKSSKIRKIISCDLTNEKQLNAIIKEHIKLAENFKKTFSKYL